MIVIPTHACSADDGRLPASDVYGELGADNVATCALRVRWGFQRGQDKRVPGCGARIAVCHGCGLRTRVNGAPCGACGGDERPEVLHVHDREVLADGAHGGTGTPVVPVTVDAAVRTADVPGSHDYGPRRETKEKAPSRSRAPAKRVKKGAVAPDGPELPFVK